MDDPHCHVEKKAFLCLHHKPNWKKHRLSVSLNCDDTPPGYVQNRPDMALFKFSKAILAEKPIQVFNHGKHRRDFTYIDDIVEVVIRVLDRSAPPNPEWSGDHPDTGTSTAPWRVYNIGNNNPVDLMDFIEALEKALGKTAKKEFLPLQTGDIPDTYADVKDLFDQFFYKPSTTIEDGIVKFVNWYNDYFAKRNSL